MEAQKYLFRRQFVLGPRYIKTLQGWKKVEINGSLFLTVHPDLKVTEIRWGTNFLILLGYILDPFNPSDNDYQIIERMQNNAKAADDIINFTAEMCGRFVIIKKYNDDFRIFHDAGGLRQVFYHIDKSNQLWCASQPIIIAEELGIDVDENIKADLYKTFLFTKSPDHWYPGNITLFKEISHLTPNHYLDLNKNKCIRYWPKKPLKPISVTEYVEEISKVLRGILESAGKRFNLVLGISSGLDSRLLLSASKKQREKIVYFTQKNKKMDYENPDILIPKDLCNTLGLDHKTLTIPDKMDSEFEKYFKRNVFTSRKVKGLNAYSIYKDFLTDQNEIVLVSGNMAEITKRDRYRWPRLPNFLITPSALTEMAQMSGSKIAFKQFSDWFNSVKNFTEYNLNILDLMHWEQRVGNWAAMTFSEYDIAFETLCPYNCRKYIEYMLRVPFKFRTMPDYILHHKIISNLWAETLKHKVTTVNRETNMLKYKFINFLYRTNLYDIVKYIYIMTYRKFK